MRRLLLPFSLGVIALGALIAASLDELIAHVHASTTQTYAVWTSAPTAPAGTYGMFPNLGPPPWYAGRSGFTVLTARSVGGGALSAAQWWRSGPTLAVAIATLVLMAMALAASRHQHRYTPTVGRLLGASGIVALLGGPLAVLVAALAPRWVGGDWVHTTLWPQALLWVLIGGSVLAVRDLLARTAELRTELDGVI
ncbi:MAG TPA: hypothetical protein VKB59_23555 [Micromonosporaceae bacterium]|nr:hypothetical protein [Micromonosporaceae bacterium]